MIFFDQLYADPFIQYILGPIKKTLYFCDGSQLKDI
jgi:hypothetical protein